MTLIGVIVFLVIIGLVMYLINTLIPMDPRIKTILNVVVIIFILIWLLQTLGILGGFGDMRIR